MIITPNEQFANSRNDKYPKNDLYRMFKVPFDILLNEQFDEGGQYRKDTYVHVDYSLEERINDAVKAYKNLVLPLVGNKGVGKTHLLMALFAQLFDKERIRPNNVYIRNYENDSDVLFYVSFDSYPPEMLKDPSGLFGSIVKCLCAEIEDKFHIAWDEVNFREYINSNKRVVNYYAEDLKDYSISRMKLKYLISKSRDFGHSIRNLIIVYDDLESLAHNVQEQLVFNMTNLFECLKNGRPRDTHYKFFVCLRRTTYSMLLKKETFDTHRIEEAAILNECPQLNELFKKRFESYERQGNLRDNRENKENWDEAQKVLYKLTEKLDNESSGMLYELSNHNVCKTLRKFSNVLSNRKWTQQDKNKYSAFKIEGSDYFINRVNIFKVLFKGEKEFYWSSNSFEPNIFIKPGIFEFDLLCLYLLGYFCFLDDRGNKDYCSLDDLLIDIAGVLQEIDVLKEKVASIISYYDETEILKSDDVPYESGSKVYHITSKGKFLFKEFLDESILFEIYRDTFSLDTDLFDTNISDRLTQEELFTQYYKYISEFWKYEKMIIDAFKDNMAYRYYYQAIYGNTTMSSRMLSGLLKSLDVSINMLSRHGEDCESRESLKGNIKSLRQDIDTYFS